MCTRLGMFVKYLLTIVEKLRKIIYRFEKGGEEIFLFLEEHERDDSKMFLRGEIG